MDCLLQKRAPAFVIQEFYNESKGLPYVGFYIFEKPCLLIRHPEIIKHILVKDFENFCDHYSSPGKEDRLGWSSVFLMKNPTWKIVRHKLSPIFTSKQLKRMFDLLLEIVVNLDSHIDKIEFNGETKEIDVKDFTTDITTNMICSIAFGLNIDAINNPECELRKTAREIFEVDKLRGFKLLMVFFYPQLSRYISLRFFEKKTSDLLRKIFWETINYRLKSGEKRNDVIDTLIDLKEKYKDQDFEDFKFDGDDLLAQAAIFFTGGYETTASAMSFTFYELAVQPKIQDRLRREILDVLNENEGKITYDMVLSLSYLEMVIAETLRKYPILATLDRKAMQDYKIPNHDLVIEKGTPIFFSLFGMHYDPKYFPDPEKFDPERFSKENKSSIPSCVYMPFGEGPRGCIANRLGKLQTKLGIIKLLSQYEVTPSEKTAIPMVLDPKNPVTAPVDMKLYLNIRKIDTNAK
ncbi:Cytochrome P450 6k1 [Harpegnathos saltator]|uniref:Cytochrome P450 6k1 n=2 Tax=Harpegnathos saltator TaxID=610380 RepID=E2C251_HARSA|nr:Cytochrome P450 6k1 [Harpegnathos saltator]